MGFWAVAAPALISAGAGLAGKLLSGGKPKPPKSAQYSWINREGPGMWGDLKSYGTQQMQTTTGFDPAVKSGMQRQGRRALESGYEEASRRNQQRYAQSGLAPSSGDLSKREMELGYERAGQIGDLYTNIDIADWQAAEEKRNRGANLLLALSSSVGNPAYSQIVSQNYWNALQDSRQQQAGIWQGLGNMAGDLYSSYLNMRYEGEQGAEPQYSYPDDTAWDTVPYDPNYAPPQYDPYSEPGTA